MTNTEYLTTGQAAKYCHVSQTTIVNWIKRGELAAHATPGGHHRILLSDFLSFLETYSMPVASTLASSSRLRVLVVGDGSRAMNLAHVLHDDERFDISLTSNEYEAGAQTVRFHPDVVVLDMASTTLDCWALCRWLHDTPQGRSIRVLAIGDPEDEAIALAAGVDTYLSNGSAVDRLEEELDALIVSGQGKQRPTEKESL